ncbi:MAG: outer membrane protein transport protein [Desulfomonilia bacterium]
MRRISSILALTVMTIMVSSSGALATNGDNLIGIGPISRSMGGVGIAAPQDAISAVFANPAAMCVGPYCPASAFDFAGTLFMPKIKGEVDTNGSIVKSDSADTEYSIPAIGISVPITDKLPLWRFGLAAYGVTGLGVDYRGKDLDKATLGGSYPLVSGSYTSLQVMKFAPAIAFEPMDKLSLGMAVHIDYATLDLRDGSSPNYGAGVQLGALYHPIDPVTIGLNYTTPQRVTYKNVADFEQNGTLDNLKLDSPQQLGGGVAYENPTIMNLLVEADVTWVNWSNAAGYSDFDWKDQCVYALGVQVEPVKRFTLRAGYNYGNNPVKKHNNFNGSFNFSNPQQPVPNSVKNVQGSTLPTYYYETFRIIGFPAIVEQHITCGAGYKFTDRFAVNLGYMHAFENTISESGTNPLGQPVTLKSKLSEDSLDFGLTWYF